MAVIYCVPGLGLARVGLLWSVVQTS